jgi:glycerol-3-phosphate dehydrogenase (NAD(P)+)
MSMLEEVRKKQPTVITVLGGGSWATAIIKILTENQVKVRWWLRRKIDADYIKKYHHNPNYLDGVRINPSKVKTFYRMNDALQGSSIVVLAIPAVFVPEMLQSLNRSHFEGKKVVSGIKGMIQGENLLVTDWLEKAFGIPQSRLCVIAGPCHAEEVALEKQSFLTIASSNYACAEEVAQLMTCRFIRSHAIGDLFGIEYCAVMKNIIALACGIAHGLHYGDNFQAVLVSNAMQEIQRFVDAVYPTTHRDLSGSGYLGDLLVTAYSQFSRNRTFGNMIGRGYSVKAIQMEMNMIAEGYYAVRSIVAMNQHYQVHMPITQAVYQILYENAPPKDTFQQLIEALY